MAFRLYKGYQIHSDGRILGKRRKFLSLGVDKDGYRMVIIQHEGERKTKRVSRLVAECFIANTGNKPVVNHKNGIKHDNRVENLEWCTRSENDKHAYATGLRKARVINVKLTRTEVGEIRQLLSAGKLSQTEIAVQYGVKQPTISNIKTGKRWGVSAPAGG